MSALPFPPLLEPSHGAGPGTALLRRGAPAAVALFVQSGRVATGVVGEPDAGAVMEHQLGTVDGPAWLEVSAVVLDAAHVVDAVALTPVQYHQVSLADFRGQIGACPEPVRQVVADLARAHRQQTELAVSRLVKDAEARCAEWLLSHASTGDKGSWSVQLQLRKRALAAQLGIAPETLSRVLRHLRERSLISGSGRTVSLLDPSALRRLAGMSATAHAVL